MQDLSKKLNILGNIRLEEFLSSRYLYENLTIEFVRLRDFENRNFSRLEKVDKRKIKTRIDTIIHKRAVVWVKKMSHPIKELSGQMRQKKQSSEEEIQGMYEKFYVLRLNLEKALDEFSYFENTQVDAKIFGKSYHKLGTKLNRARNDIDEQVLLLLSKTEKYNFQ